MPMERKNISTQITWSDCISAKKNGVASNWAKAQDSVAGNLDTAGGVN